MTDRWKIVLLIILVLISLFFAFFAGYGGWSERHPAPDERAPASMRHADPRIGDGYRKLSLTPTGVARAAKDLAKDGQRQRKAPCLLMLRAGPLWGLGPGVRLITK